MRLDAWKCDRCGCEVAQVALPAGWLNVVETSGLALSVDSDSRAVRRQTTRDYCARCARLYRALIRVMESLRSGD